VTKHGYKTKHKKASHNLLTMFSKERNISGLKSMEKIRTRTILLVVVTSQAQSKPKSVIGVKNSTTYIEPNLFNMGRSNHYCRWF